MEHLVGLAKDDDLLTPLTLEDQEWSEGMSRLNARAVAWRDHEQVLTVVWTLVLHS